MDEQQNYTILPFRFKKLNNKYLLTNDIGQFCFMSISEFQDFITGILVPNSKIYNELISSQIITKGRNSTSQIEMLANAYRTKKSFLFDFTSLHMIVITKRCNQQCTYCHASSLPENDSLESDMSIKTLHNTIDIILKSPAQFLKIEIQGGEPLLRFDLIKELVRYANNKNNELPDPKHLEFVVCTNLLIFTDEIAIFFRDNQIQVSTSLDGPQKVHDECRKIRNGDGSFKIVKGNIRKALEFLPKGNVGALLTVTNYSLDWGIEIVNEYIDLGLTSIFLRPLNPFGRAENKPYYSTDTYLEFYKKILKYIIDINNDFHFVEIYTTILLTRILTPFSTGFVDLQSPAGVGISGVIYDIDGYTFISDEARMYKYSTGDMKFSIGNVNNYNWNEIFCNSKLQSIIKNSMLETMIPCAWCVYLPYCGADPVRNFSIYGNIAPNMIKTETCIRHKKMFEFLINLIEENNSDYIDVFWSWITNRNLSEISDPQKYIK